MKDRLVYGLLAGAVAPLIIILLLWTLRFHYLTLDEFIRQAVLLKVQFKIVALGVFFADLVLFYLFLHFNKSNASKGIICAVFLYFFLFLLVSL